MKKLLLILTIVLLSLYSNAQKLLNYNLDWSSSVQDIRSLYRYQPFKMLKKSSETLLYYNDKLYDLNSIVMYKFTNSKLSSISYFLNNKHEKKILYLKDYNFLVNKITKKYGKNIKNESYWFTNKYRNEKNKWGDAISLGHMSRYTEFDNKGTNVFLLIRGSDGEIRTTIYESKK